MALDRVRGVGNRELRGAEAAVLAGSLALSASLTALAVRGPDHHWLVWISLLPLFQAIRSLGWSTAAMAGGLWGTCLYYCCIVGPAPAVVPSVLSLVLLAAVPAAYTGLGARLTRAVGFSPGLLALGWILVEIALQPVGLRQGLLARPPAQSTHLLWIGHLLGYAFMACLVAAVNAVIVSALAGVSVGGARPAPLRGSTDPGRCAIHRTFPVLLLFAIRPSQPRGPPAPAVGN